MKERKIEAMAARTTSVVKAFTWRFIATTITTLLVFFMTGRLDLAAKVGVLDVVTKLIAYYLHERGWLRYGQRLEVLTAMYGKLSNWMAPMRDRAGRATAYAMLGYISFLTVAILTSITLNYYGVVNLSDAYLWF